MTQHPGPASPLRATLASLLALCALAAPSRAEAPSLVISGLVFEFGGTGKVLANTRVCVLEEPNRACVSTDANGVYRIPLKRRPEGPTPVTVVVGELRYHAMRGPTLMLGQGDDLGDEAQLSTWHLQSVIGPLYTAYTEAVSAAAREQLHLDLCRVAGTVSDYQKAHHYAVSADGGALQVDYAGFLTDRVHGFAGAKVHLLAPAPGSATGWTEVLGHGPIYSSDRVVPMAPDVLGETTGDGGFFFYNLPEGHYRVEVEDTQHGHAPDHPVAFNGPLTVDCTRDPEFRLPGVFVNVAPPALHALEDVQMYPRPEAEPLHLPERPKKEERSARP